MTLEFKYQCDYCHARFKTESRFMKHYCKAMKREEDFKSLEGQAAHIFYQEWMKCKHHASMTSPLGFKESRYFNIFLKFVDFSIRTRLPDTTAFIELMVKSRIEPNNWTSDIAYGKYLEWFTRVSPAEKLIGLTVNTMFEIVDDTNIDDVSNIFTVLTPNEVIQLIQQRRLSPWILINSKKFAVFVHESANSEERVIMESIINPEYWLKRFVAYPNDLKYAKEVIVELGL